MTINRASLNGIIQFLSLIYYRHLKNKKLCSLYHDNTFTFFPEFNVFPVTKNVTHDETRQQFCKVDPGDKVTLPLKFACKPELTLTCLLG